MATLLARSNLTVTRTARSDHACSASVPTAGVRVAHPSAGVSVIVTLPQASRHGSRQVVRSIPVSGPGAAGSSSASGGVPGQVTSQLMESMRSKICEALETDKCTVTDMYGDGRHVSIDVVSKLFQDKNSMQRQRMVYKAIWMELQEAVHAVDSMSTQTPEEAASS